MIDPYEFHPRPPGRKTGLIPRNYLLKPVGCYAHAPSFDLPLIPRSEWADRKAQKDKDKSWLSDIRDRGNFGQPIPSLDQDGYGYCWAHSSTSACMLVRAINDEPYLPLSAFMVASIIKGGRDEGGNGIDSTEFISTTGICTQALWPQGTSNLKYDTAECRADAAKTKFQEWMDLEPDNLDQYVTCLLSDIPVVADRDGWSHSTCDVKIISLSPLTVWTWNSWGDSWANNGVGRPEGGDLPNGMCAPRVVSARAA